MDAPILELDRIAKRFGATTVARELSLAVERGAFFTFLGPSGSGKSTILRMVAGLERPDSGRIVIDGRDMSGTPPWARNLGMMFQSYAIFPHMTAAENVGYGLKVRGLKREEIARRTAEMLALVGLQGFGEKSATLLSGGEQQRVALARALAPEPRMLLLDEPLSALDEKIRRTMQGELKRIHRSTGTTFLYVTHDQEEALTMSDRIAVFNNGACVECDRPERLFRRPRTRFVASFFRGCNILKARSEGGGRMSIAGIVFAAPEAVLPGEVHVAVRSENVHAAAPFPGDVVRLPARLVEQTFRGMVLDCALELGDGQMLSATSTRPVAADESGRLEIGIDPREVVVLED